MRNCLRRTIWATVIFGMSTASAQTVPGSIPGSFEVTLSGSAHYTIPIRVAPGTAGMEPKLSLVYDSQAPSGPLGAGWSLAGLSTITRGPKNSRFDGLPDGVRLLETDALYLDGQRLVAISSVLSGASMRKEFRKEVDDQTRIIQLGDSFATAQFLVDTKGGLQIEFDSVPGAPSDQNRGDISFSDHTVLLRAQSRVLDSSGNYIDFFYKVNGSGDFDIKTIRYTGHRATATSPDQLPYAVVDFTYDTAPRFMQSFVAGRALVVDSRLKEITVRAAEDTTNPASSRWLQVARYALDYEEREAANRFVLTSVHQSGEDGKELTPTQFRYASPTAGWIDAKYNFPAIFAKQQQLGLGYRFAHVSKQPTSIPDLLYGVQVDGKLEAFSFRNTGTSWEILDAFKPPVAFTSADGSDLGTIIADVSGDGRADLLQSYQSAGQASVTSYIAGANGWDRQTGFDLPFVVAKDGKVVALYRFARWTGGPGPDLLYQSGTQLGFLTNTWQEYR